MKKRIFMIFIFLFITILGFTVEISSVEEYINSQKQHLAKLKAEMFVRMRRFNLNDRVKKAIEDTQRERFAFHRTNLNAAKENIRAAYLERPLAIGYGQTISSPNMVAIMTKLAEPSANDVVLEIGTGSGYQAAILSKLAKKVYSIEIVKQLTESTDKVYAKYGYQNISTKAADGYYGWAENGPYDKILVTCATNHIPPQLIQQLKRGGVMLVPVGHPYKTQELIEVKKMEDGRVTTRRVMNVKFVPMTGRAMKRQ
jgi:protein-L-isoaspartate(D-aspartate) O-methyltransferase